jgi:hypothetical protein
MEAFGDVAPCLIESDYDHPGSCRIAPADARATAAGAGRAT